jgi:hypothetical protein
MPNDHDHITFDERTLRQSTTCSATNFATKVVKFILFSQFHSTINQNSNPLYFANSLKQSNA